MQVMLFFYLRKKEKLLVEIANKEMRKKKCEKESEKEEQKRE